MKRTLHGFDIEIERKSGHQVTLRCGEFAHDWAPNPKTGRTKKEIADELNQALENFCQQMAAHKETAGHLDAIFGGR